MTSCLLVKAPDRIAAVADGRLSISDTMRSFERTQKIVRFVPRYRIPRVMVSRFSHYDDYTGRECFVAYAGSYALAGEVLNLFRKLVTERLVLVWRDGLATLDDHFDEGALFGEYDFLGSDYPDLSPEIVLQEFRSAAQQKVDEFCEHRRERAECEFLLFGQDAQRRYYAHKVSVDSAWSPGQRPRLIVEPVADGALTAIGSTAVSGAAFDDGELHAGLEGWRTDQSRLGVSTMLAELDWQERYPDRPYPSPSSTLAADRNWSSRQVASRFCQHVRQTGDGTVGGDLTVAIGGWYGDIDLKTVT